MIQELAKSSDFASRHRQRACLYDYREREKSRVTVRLEPLTM